MPIPDWNHVWTEDDAHLAVQDQQVAQMFADAAAERMRYSGGNNSPYERALSLTPWAPVDPLYPASGADTMAWWKALQIRINNMKAYWVIAHDDEGEEIDYTGRTGIDTWDSQMVDPFNWVGPHDVGQPRTSSLPGGTSRPFPPTPGASSPIGWRRVYARTIQSLSDTGSEGWVARFEATGSTLLAERPLSGKYYTRIGGVWVETPEAIDPDHIEGFGLIQTGDYWGAHILNDLRTALNVMVWTFGVVDWTLPVSPPSRSGRRGSPPLASGPTGDFVDSDFTAVRSSATSLFNSTADFPSDRPIKVGRLTCLPKTSFNSARVGASTISTFKYPFMKALKPPHIAGHGSFEAQIYSSNSRIGEIDSVGNISNTVYDNYGMYDAEVLPGFWFALGDHIDEGDIVSKPSTLNYNGYLGPVYGDTSMTQPAWPSPPFPTPNTLNANNYDYSYGIQAGDPLAVIKFNVAGGFLYQE
ncbi:MAG TPA: hypothetical protein VGN72_01130 [Tepidisphaeraceae bacterium]|jgi:hypothetical protein|nr:hypothetical protein [Tepidisphaeraceae bacterium]